MIVQPTPGDQQGPPRDDDPAHDPVAVFAELIRRWDAGRVGDCVATRNELATLGWRVEPRCRPGRRRKAVPS